jgi:hypothetical protein
LAAPPPAPPGATAPPAAYPAYPPPGAYPAAYPPPPPGYAYAYPVARRAPESAPYDGGPVPPGYHVEEQSRRGPIIAGAVVIGSAYALGLAVASTENFPNSTGWLVVPVLGPWITLAARHRNVAYCTGFDVCNGTSDDDNTTRTMLILDGLTQATGTILLAYGLSSSRKVIARDFVGSLHFVPSEIGRGGVGGFVLGQF